MSEDRRTDTQGARIVNAAIQVDTSWGCIRAWRYLHLRQITPDVALRVLSRDGPRRVGDAVHPAVRDARSREPIQHFDQRSQGSDGGPQTGLPRTNLAAALAVEHAIRSAASVDRFYAESLLRIYGLNTATTMRVLFQPHRRRRVAELL